jgi:hypothetical protein
MKMEKEVLITVTDRKCPWLQTSQTIIEIQNNTPMDDLVKIIDEFIDETEYRKVDVVIDPLNFEFTREEVEYLIENDIEVY